MLGEMGDEEFKGYIEGQFQKASNGDILEFNFMGSSFEDAMKLSETVNIMVVAAAPEGFYVEKIELSIVVLDTENTKGVAAYKLCS